MKSIPGKGMDKCEDLGHGPQMWLGNSQEVRLQQKEHRDVREVSRAQVGEGRLHFCSERYGMSLEQESDAAEMYAGAMEKLTNDDSPASG